MSAYEIIGKLYTFLSECSGAELVEAARIAGDSDLGLALRELAKFKQHQENKQSSKRVATATVQDSPRRTHLRNGIEHRIERVVLDPGIIKSNIDVAKFLSSLGLAASFRKKDGRQLMLRKLREALSELDDDTQKKTLAKIYALLPKSETAGWFEAIRGDGP